MIWNTQMSALQAEKTSPALILFAQDKGEDSLSLVLSLPSSESAKPQGEQIQGETLIISVRLQWHLVTPPWNGSAHQHLLHPSSDSLSQKTEVPVEGITSGISSVFPFPQKSKLNRSWSQVPSIWNLPPEEHEKTITDATTGMKEKALAWATENANNPSPTESSE